LKINIKRHRIYAELIGFYTILLFSIFSCLLLIGFALKAHDGMTSFILLWAAVHFFRVAAGLLAEFSRGVR